MALSQHYDGKWQQKCYSFFLSDTLYVISKKLIMEICIQHQDLYEKEKPLTHFNNKPSIIVLNFPRKGTLYNPFFFLCAKGLSRE